MLCVGAVLPFCALAARLLPHGSLPLDGDYAQYLLHARALLEGRPYIETGYLYTPQAGEGPVAYPPGLSYTLYALFSVLGTRVGAARLLVLASALVFLFLVGLYFTRHYDRRLGWLVPLLIGLTPGLAAASVEVFSDLPFAALCWSVIFLADRDGPWTWKRLVAMSALGAGAVLYRTPGVALVGAAVLFSLRNYSIHRFRPLIPAIVWLAVFAIMNRVLPILAGYGADMAQVPGFVPRVVRNAIGFIKPAAEAHLYPFPWNGANDVYHVLSLLVMAVGLAVWARRHSHRFVLHFALVYGALLLPYTASTPRYLVPVLPLLSFGLIRGFMAVVSLGQRALRGRHVDATRLTLAVFITLAALATLTAWQRPRDRSMDDNPAFAELFRFVRQHESATPMRVLFYNPRVLTWHTRVPAMAPFGDRVEALVAEMDRHGVTHVIVGSPPGDDSWPDAIPQLIAERGASFQLVYSNEMFRVYVRVPSARS